jgi:DNA-binding winged helix-turn-helix (wHTH) protein
MMTDNTERDDREVLREALKENRKRNDKMIEYYKEQGYDMDARIEQMRDDEYRKQVIDKLYDEAMKREAEGVE